MWHRIKHEKYIKVPDDYLFERKIKKKRKFDNFFFRYYLDLQLLIFRYNIVEKSNLFVYKISV